MKIRLDFVTNSSSSSFVIAHANEEVKFDKETLEKYPFLSQYNLMVDFVIKSFQEDRYNDFNSIKDIETLQDYIHSEYDWQRKMSFDELLATDKYAKEKYENYSKYINDGYTISFLTIPNYLDSSVKTLLKTISDNNSSVIMVDSEED